MPDFTGHLTDPRWITVDEKAPADEQTVLACWHGPSCTPGMESLTYHAADAPDGPEAWSDAWGETRDPPTHWMPLPAWPCHPKRVEK